MVKEQSKIFLRRFKSFEKLMIPRSLKLYHLEITVERQLIAKGDTKFMFWVRRYEIPMDCTESRLTDENKVKFHPKTCRVRSPSEFRSEEDQLSENRNCR